MTAPTFETLFRQPPSAAGWAHGRVNLMGDHTDYNAGFVLPIAIPQQTHVEIAAAPGCTDHEAHSVTLKQTVLFVAAEGVLPDFARYIGGCVRVLEERGVEVPPLKWRIASDVPVGAGLSSSAALEVAALRALNSLLSLGLDSMEIATLAWTAERRHAGVACGIMDQMACALATTDKMLFLDTLTLATDLLPLPKDAELLVIHSGVERRLAESAYNLRRSECERAAAALGVETLREITCVSSLAELPSPMKERARHVVTENARVLAARTADASAFGALMSESHLSLRDDYEVSIEALDALVDALQREQGVFGARMTGAGFGGAVVALTKEGQAERIGILVTHRNRWSRDTAVIVPTSDPTSWSA
jgi:galactokinase